MSQLKSSTDCTILFDTLTIDLEWIQKGSGFGKIHIYKDHNSEEIELSNECLSRDRVREILYRMVDTIIEEATFYDE